MATISTALRNEQAAVVGACNRLDLYDDTTLLATIVVSFGSPSGGSVSANPDPVSAVAGGVADNGRLYVDGDASREITGLIVGTHINLNNPNIVQGQTVDVTSIVYTADSNVGTPS